MNFSSIDEEIDYDKLIDYELSCLRNDDIDEGDQIFLENNIAEDDSYDVILEKISEAHEEFYKTCFYNASCEDEEEVRSDHSDDSLLSRTKRILNSFNISYEEFVMTLPRISSEMEECFNQTTFPASVKSKGEGSYNPVIEDWISHETVLKQINDEKLSQYDSFLNKFSERCKSARLETKKQLEEQLAEENKRRQILQTKMESELSLLDHRYKLDEAENKLKMLEIESEIEEEKKVMARLQNEVIEVINVKYHKAATMIQKVFRRYRIRKRIGTQIDEVREKARKTLFNKKLIILEKENHRKRAVELRKWRKDRDKEDKANKVKVKIDLEKEDDMIEIIDIIEEDVSTTDIRAQGNNNNLQEYEEITALSEVKCDNEEVNKCCEVLQNLQGDILKKCCDDREIVIKSEHFNKEKEETIQNETENNRIYSYKNLNDDLTTINNTSIVTNEKIKGNVISSQIGNSNFLEVFTLISPINETLKFKDEEIQDLYDPVLYNVEDGNGGDRVIINAEGRLDIEKNSEKDFSYNKHVVHIPESGHKVFNSENKSCTSKEKNNLELKANVKHNENSVDKYKESDIEDKIKSQGSLVESECEVSVNENYISNAKTSMEEDVKKALFEDTDSKNNGTYVETCENDRLLGYLPKNIQKEKCEDKGTEDILEDTIDTFLEFDNNRNKERTIESNVKDKIKFEGDMSKSDIREQFKEPNMLEDTKNAFGINIETNRGNNIEIEEDLYKIGLREKDISERNYVKATLIKDIKNDILEYSEIKEVKNIEDRIIKETEFGKDEIYKTHFKNVEIIKEYNSEDFWRKEAFVSQNQSTKEVFLNEIFFGDKLLIQLCLNWLTYKNEKKDTYLDNDGHSEVHNIELNVPKHLYEESNFSQMILNHTSDGVTFSPSHGLIESRKSLMVKDTPVRSLEGISGICPFVECLTVNNTSLKFIASKDIVETLMYLNLDKNKLEWACFNSNNCRNLVSISCMNNDLAVLPPGAFRNCEALTILDLSDNNFLYIENIFRDSNPLKKLSYLNLSGNVLSNVESLGYHCPYLTHLSVSNNHIKTWLKEDFPFLLECNFSHNSLSEIGKISDSPLLIKLDFSNNSLNNLGDLGESWLPCLSELIIDSNKLAELPQFSFPILQTLSIKKNYIADLSDVEERLNACPLISIIDFRQNATTVKSSSYKFKDIIIHDDGDISLSRVPCPTGEFAMACYDFVDRIQNKSKILEINLKSSSSAEVLYKHNFHFYKVIRDATEDFLNWMLVFFCQKNSLTETFPNNSENLTSSQNEIEAAIIIQALWRGYRIRKWFKQILKNIKFETEKSFENFIPSELSEFNEDYFLGDWGCNAQALNSPKKAWINSNCDVINIQNTSLKKAESYSWIDENILPSCETSSRSSSIPYGQAVILGRKSMEIMKEWGFEDPNSAKLMQQRAKHFKGKSEKVTKSPVPKMTPSSHIKLSQNHRLQKTVSTGMAPISMVTLQPPGSSQSNNSKAKICAWLLDSDCSVVQGPKNKSFLPVIENDTVNNKIFTDSIRRDSLTTKLPPINITFTNKQ